MAKEASPGWHVESYRVEGDETEADAKAHGDEERQVAALFGLGQFGHDIWAKGLMFLANQAVFHNFGYALGVQLTEPAEDGSRKCHGLIICKTDDPDGITFDEATINEGRQKLRHAWDPVDEVQLAAIRTGFAQLAEARKQLRVAAGAEALMPLLALMKIEPGDDDARRTVATGFAAAVLESADGTERF